MKEVQEIKESIFDLNDSMEKAFSYFEVINRSVRETVSQNRTWMLIITYPQKFYEKLL
jgi:hypothetical protein